MNSRYCSCLCLHLLHPTVFFNLKPWMDLLKVVTSPVIKSSLHSTAYKKAFSIQSCLTLQLCLPLITVSHIPLSSGSLRTHSVGVSVPLHRSICPLFFQASLINSWQCSKCALVSPFPLLTNSESFLAQLPPLYPGHTSPLKLTTAQHLHRAYSVPDPSLGTEHV